MWSSKPCVILYRGSKHSFPQQLDSHTRLQCLKREQNVQQVTQHVKNLGVPHAKAIIQVIAKPFNIPCCVKAFVMHYLDSCRRTFNGIFGQGIFLEQSITLLKAPNTSHTLFYLNDVLHTYECPISYTTCKKIKCPTCQGHHKSDEYHIAKPNISSSVKAFGMHYLDCIRRTLDGIFGQ